MEKWNWGEILVYGIGLAILLAAILRIWEITVQCRKVIDDIRECSHARQMERIDKMIALEKAKRPEVPPCGPTQ
jgi:hypothetical protein